MKTSTLKDIILLCIFLLAPLLIVSSNELHSQTGGNNTMKNLIVQSNAFKHNEIIPSKYTCDGSDVSPQIKWAGAPGHTKSYAIICDDPDAPAGDWVHWIVFNIPANSTELPEHFITKSGAIQGAKAGINDFRKFEYGGPCPPSGTHRYFFKVFALDSILTLGEGATKRELLQAMNGHVLAKGELVGKYSRKR